PRRSPECPSEAPSPKIRSALLPATSSCSPHYRIGAMSARRPPIVGRYTAEEVELATRNHGMPLEALRYDVTPAGLHYLLVHFDIPPSDEGWSLGIGGLVERPFSVSLAELRSEDSLTIRVGLSAKQKAGGWQLDGVKLFVPDAEAADYTVVVARSRGEGEE